MIKMSRSHIGTLRGDRKVLRVMYFSFKLAKLVTCISFTQRGSAMAGEKKKCSGISPFISTSNINNVDGDLAESIKRSASDRLGDLVP